MKISDNKPTKRKIVLDFDRNEIDSLHRATMLMYELNEKLEELIEDNNDIELTERYSPSNVCARHYLKDFLTETAKVLEALEDDLEYPVDDIMFEIE